MDFNLNTEKHEQRRLLGPVKTLKSLQLQSEMLTVKLTNDLFGQWLELLVNI